MNHYKRYCKKASLFLKNFFFCTSFFFCFSQICGAIIISGQPGTVNQPFPFTVKATTYNPYMQALFIGANEPITVEADKSQAISFVDRTMNAVIGITPEFVSFNNSVNQQNPLYGQQINFLALPIAREISDPFVVTAGQNTQVSFIRNASTPGTRAVFQSSPLHDGANLITNGIVGLTALSGSIVKVNEELSLPGNERFFAAISPNGGVFGDNGSGIAAGQFFVINQTDENNPGATHITYTLNQTAFYLLDKTSPALAIGSPLASIDNVNQGVPVVMSSFSFLNNYYTGLCVTGGGAPNDGAIGVSLNGNGAITQAAALEADSIIGGIGANKQISIHFLNFLYTSTQLQYLIVVGGVGTPSETAQSVYSLPITISGYLAQKNAIPVAVYEPILGLLQNRYFPDIEMAQNPGDLFSPDDLSDIYKARVGGNGVLPGPITAVFAEKDAVFVTVGTNSATEMAGMFCSEMIFDNLGRQQGWTDWRRSAGTTNQLFNGAYDLVGGTFWYFPGTDANSLTMLYKTSFLTNMLSSFNQSIQNAFQAPLMQNQGVQGLFDFEKTNPAFDQTVGSRISVLCTTGYQKVVLFQNGADVGTLFTPTAAISQSFTSTNNSLAGLVTPVQEINMTGSVLENIGPIIAADIVSDGTYSWLVVGGSHGVAVLANSDGSGWHEGQLQVGFANLPPTLTWTPLGNFQQVRKIIADGTNLYILTSSSLYRIQAGITTFSNPQSLNLVQLASTNILGIFNQYGTFSDIAISGKFALLATSIGLFRVGNGKDISVAQNEILVDWTAVQIPEGSGPVTRLFVIAPTSDTTTFATDSRGGTIYALNATVSMHTTNIARFSVQGGGAPISDTTLQGVGDLFAQGIPSIYTHIGTYRNYMVTDGAALFVLRSAYFPQKTFPFLQILNPSLRAGVHLELTDYESFVQVINTYRIGPMIKRSVDGSWMIAGNQLMIGA